MQGFATLHGNGESTTTWADWDMVCGGVLSSSHNHTHAWLVRTPMSPVALCGYGLESSTDCSSGRALGDMYKSAMSGTSPQLVRAVAEIVRAPSSCCLRLHRRRVGMLAPALSAGVGVGVAIMALLAHAGPANADAAAAAPRRLLQLPVERAADDEVDAGWHAPKQTSLNNLTAVLGGSGVYGFIYNSSVTPDERYGTYNWCNMPHVRRTEYVRPPSEFELQYVELIHRHHKRTPYASNAFPVESYQWNCDDAHLSLYGDPLDGHDPSKVFRKGYISPVNPFVPAGWIGTCSFPQITAEGLDDSWQHGADLYGVYHDLLGFLPSRSADFASAIRYRVTNNVITSQVAGMVVNGMWGTTEAFPLMIQAEGVDSLEPQYSCNTANSLFNNIKSNGNPAWSKHLTDAADLYRTLDDISGVPANDGGFHASFDHYYDNLSARQCHGKPLPCKLVNGANSSTCVAQDLADAVYRMGHWEYSQIYRDHPSSLPASAASLGVWVGELATHLRAFMNGSTDVIYFHNIAHDGSVSRLLAVLQIDEMVWPGMGSEVIFELYKRKSAQPRPTSSPSTSGCAHDNCLRHLIRNPASASALCELDRPTSTSRSASVPTRPAQCRDSAAVTSACSCLQTPTATTPASTATPTAPPPSRSEHYVRVLFGGKVLKSSNPSLGPMDMVPVETLLAYFDELVGKGASLVKSKCQG
ncbi:HET domain-containingprotein [Purpureocillium lavendulum]|uniref:HET domain-containingprotein n=1 Tax=Purpureocillium lavendulum TaxID=1247861 RepID=A0AB34FTJ4_9HYPO|nr:HET domain-containingprotein [Purpureocillium lavendulum]